VNATEPRRVPASAPVHINRGLARLPADAIRAVAIVATLAVLVVVRAVLATSGRVDGLVTGLGFGLGLLAVSVFASWSAGARRRPGPALPRARHVLTAAAVGGLAGLAVVGLTLVGRIGVPAPRVFPFADLGPWAAVTAIVVLGEEAMLRGVLFDAVSRARGPLAAVAVTSVVFALMHVPLYGVHVVLLDFGVGLILGGLRLATGGIAAPAAAHLVADIATRWL
jgi:membrane protease YdiL (CAAX protease family)